MKKDWLWQICPGCKSGKLVERHFYADMDGRVVCTHCAKQYDRYH